MTDLTKKELKEIANGLLGESYSVYYMGDENSKDEELVEIFSKLEDVLDARWDYRRDDDEDAANGFFATRDTVKGLAFEHLLRCYKDLVRRTR